MTNRLPVSRNLTKFETERRADLIAGHGNRWEVSTPRDELEKLRFFARHIELLIDQAEESEIDSLKASVHHLSKDSQDEFWLWNYPIHWDEIFRSAVRNSLVVTLATFLETYLEGLRKNVALVAKREPNLPDEKGSGLEKARKFLLSVGNFSRPSLELWKELGVFLKIRNVIVHTAGFAAGSKYKNAIEEFCRDRADVGLSYGTIEIQPEFFDFIINRLLVFVEELEGEFHSLCLRTKESEGLLD